MCGLENKTSLGRLGSAGVDNASVSTTNVFDKNISSTSVHSFVPQGVALKEQAQDQALKDLDILIQVSCIENL